MESEVHSDDGAEVKGEVTPSVSQASYQSAMSTPSTSLLDKFSLSSAMKSHSNIKVAPLTLTPSTMAPPPPGGVNKPINKPIRVASDSPPVNRKLFEDDDENGDDLDDDDNNGNGYDDGSAGDDMYYHPDRDREGEEKLKQTSKKTKQSTTSGTSTFSKLLVALRISKDNDVYDNENNEDRNSNIIISQNKGNGASITTGKSPEGTAKQDLKKRHSDAIYDRYFPKAAPYRPPKHVHVADDGDGDNDDDGSGGDDDGGSGGDRGQKEACRKGRGRG